MEINHLVSSLPYTTQELIIIIEHLCVEFTVSIPRECFLERNLHQIRPIQNLGECCMAPLRKTKNKKPHCLCFQFVNACGDCTDARYLSLRQ